MEESANAAIVVETIWATFSSPSSCEISEARMWKNGCAIRERFSKGRFTERTHHNFDHHATVGASKAASTERIYELGDDCTNDASWVD